jgi:hypothetical protein
MLVRRNLKSALALCTGTCLIVAQLIPGISYACEGKGSSWLSIRNVSGAGEATEGALGNCEFIAVRQKCKLQFENITFRTLEVVGSKLEGEKATERYKKGTIGCAARLPLLNRETCVDELEVSKFEARTLNDYCLEVRDRGTGELGKGCAVLKM